MPRFITATLLFCLATAVAVAQTPRQPLRRADSFFGLHFDFHASQTDTLLGKTLTEGMVDSLLRVVKPDFIQIDTKGHAGWSSYPTKIGHWSGRMVRDPLRLFRDVTARHGVALYVHHSGVWDNAAITHHPHWARLTAEGKPDLAKASFWSAYSDSLLIPQLKEISDYGANGVWVDGDCWAVEPDYHPAAIQEFKELTGLPDAPRKPDDANYGRWLEFHRMAFRRYVTHYADALHRYNPRFQVASNWAFSSFMPEPVSVPVDFLSGDTDPLDGANRSAFQARCLAPQRRYGKPWDLMSWSFGYAWDGGVGSPKPAVQLCQEAAQVIALGGGFQAYWIQNRDASLTPWAFGTMAELARFCRARQPFCQNATLVPQVAVLHSTTARFARERSVYKFDASALGNLLGTLNALLYSQLSTEILSEHHLRGQMAQYPLIVIPEWNTLDSTFRDELLTYARQGGNLLVIGSEAVNLFGPALGVEMDANTRQADYVGMATELTGVRTAYRPITLRPGARPVGLVFGERDTRTAQGPLATVAPYGKGKIAGVYANIGTEYNKRESYVLRDLFGTLANQLFTPDVAVSGSHFAHVVLARQRGKTLVHLINMAGSHANKAVHSTDEVPPLGPLTVTLRSAKRPRRVMLQPAGRAVPFTYQNGRVNVALPRLVLHDILEVE